MSALKAMMPDSEDYIPANRHAGDLLHEFGGDAVHDIIAIGWSALGILAAVDDLRVTVKQVISRRIPWRG